METASSTTVQPIAFDTAEQVSEQLARLEQRIDEHVQLACRGKDEAFAGQLRAILRETVLGPLAETVHDNVAVNGKTWRDHSEQTSKATQPINSGLLKSTIQTQDAAFQLSSSNAIKRITKASQLSSQVDSRITRVIRSGQDKTDILDAQRVKRDASLRLENGAVESAQEIAKDLQNAEHELASASIKVAALRTKAERAESIAADLSLMQRR